MSKNQSVILNVIYPVMVAVILGVGGLMYAEFQSYKDLKDKLPQVEQDIRDMTKAHAQKKELEKKDREFRWGVMGRLKKLEEKHFELSQDYIKRLEIIEGENKISRSDITLILRRQDYLRKYHE